MSVSRGGRGVRCRRWWGSGRRGSDEPPPLLPLRVGTRRLANLLPFIICRRSGTAAIAGIGILHRRGVGRGVAEIDRGIDRVHAHVGRYLGNAFADRFLATADIGVVTIISAFVRIDTFGRGLGLPGLLPQLHSFSWETRTMMSTYRHEDETWKKHM